MQRVTETARERIRRSVQRDRRFEPWMDRMSHRLWPWRDAWLAAAIAVIALLDYLSTYALLNLRNKPHAYERGPLAHWALEAGGFPGLLALDAVGVTVLCLVAVVVRTVYARFGYVGYGRAAYVLVLVPYAVAASLAVVNNLGHVLI
jgi:hypothetical protein